MTSNISTTPSLNTPLVSNSSNFDESNAGVPHSCDAKPSYVHGGILLDLAAHRTLRKAERNSDAEVKWNSLASSSARSMIAASGAGMLALRSRMGTGSVCRTIFQGSLPWVKSRGGCCVSIAYKHAATCQTSIVGCVHP